MSRIRPVLEVRSPTGNLLGTIPDAAIAVHCSAIAFRIAEPVPITQQRVAENTPLRVIRIAREMWQATETLSYWCLIAGTENPDDLVALRCFTPSPSIAR